MDGVKSLQGFAAILLLALLAFLAIPLTTNASVPTFSTPEGDGWYIDPIYGYYQITGNVTVSGIFEGASPAISINVLDNATLIINDELTIINERHLYVRSGGTLQINSGATLTITCGAGYGFVNQGGVVINSGTIIHNSGIFRNTLGGTILTIPPGVTPPLTESSGGSTESAGNLVTVTGGTGGGYYAVTSAVNIAATIPSGQQFVNWTASGVTLASPNDATTSFIMPVDAVTITANFAALPTAPSITSQNKKSVTNCKGGSFQVQASGTTPIAYSITGAPAGVSIDAATGKITIPKDVPIGEHTFTLTAGNGVGSDTQDFTLTVRKCVTSIKGDVIINGGTLIIGK